MPENIQTYSTKLCLTPEEKKELEDYLDRNGLKLKFFLREAVLEKMKAVNGNRNPD